MSRVIFKLLISFDLVVAERVCVNANIFYYLTPNLYSMIITGWRRALNSSDLWSLNPRDKSQTVAPKLAKNWQHQLDKTK